MITRIELKPSSKGEDESNPSRGPVRRHTRHYQAWSDDRRADNNDILEDALCPSLGSRDPHDRSAYVEKRAATRTVHDDVGYLWDITTQTTTDFAHIEDPTQEPAHVDWSSQRVVKLTPFDRHGKAVLNKAGDIILYPMVKVLWVASVTKDCVRIPPGLAQFENAINRSSITVDGEVFAKETMNCQALRVGRWTKARVGTRDVHYRSVTFQLVQDKEGWNQHLPNVGFNELAWRRNPQLYSKHMIGAVRRSPTTDGQYRLDPVTGEIMYGPPTLSKVRITFPDGSFPTTPEPLDRNGRWIQTPQAEDLLTIEVKPDGMPLMDFLDYPASAIRRGRGAGQIPSIGGGGRR